MVTTEGAFCDFCEACLTYLIETFRTDLEGEGLRDFLVADVALGLHKIPHNLGNGVVFHFTRYDDVGVAVVHYHIKRTNLNTSQVDEGYRIRKNIVHYILVNKVAIMYRKVVREKV